MTMFKSTLPIDRKLVIKLGGSTLEQLSDAFYARIHEYKRLGYHVVITHGGGPAINRALKEKNIESKIVNGLRVTTDDMIKVVQQTLIGEVNPYVVAQLNNAGIPAIGLNGFDMGLLKALYLEESTYGHVGEITEVNVGFLNQLLALDVVPVVACIGSTDDQKPLNVNGDTVACHVAKAMEAESLLLVTDVQGIRIDGENQIAVTEQQINEWIENGSIYGGMIPKVQGALDALKAGIPTVQIVNETLVGTSISQKELVK